MATPLSFAGMTSTIGGRVPPKNKTCPVILLQGNQDLPYHCKIYCFLKGTGVAFQFERN